MKKLIILLAALITVGCVSTDNKKSSTAAMCSLSDSGVAPSWIQTPVPESEEYYYAYGVAEAKDLSYIQARKASHINARSELATSLSTKVKYSFLQNSELTRKAGANLLNETVTSNMDSQTDLFLANAFIEQSWNDLEYCIIWSKVRLHKDDYEKSKRVVEKSINTDIADQLTAMNEKLETTNTMLGNVKQETSLNPRKELMNRGIPFNGKEFGKAIMRADIEVMSLFVKGGMTFNDAYDDDFVVRLEHRIIYLSLDKLEKILSFFKYHPSSGANFEQRYLQHAAYIGSLDKVNLLLKYGVNPQTLYTGTIDIGALQSDAFTLTAASAQCVADMMIRKTKKKNIDSTQWQAISKRLSAFNASSEGKIKFAKTIVAYDIYQCDQNAEVKKINIVNQRASTCQKFFAKQSNTSLYNALTNVNVGMFQEPKSIFEAAHIALLPDILSDKFTEDGEYLSALRNKLNSTCASYKQKLCPQAEQDDYLFC